MREFTRMTKRVAPIRRRTRRGMVLGAAGLAVMLVAFGVFSSKDPIEAKFVRFDRATNGYATRAILSLANKSGKLVGSFHKDAVGVVSCRFFTHDPASEAAWKNPHVIGGGEFTLLSHSQIEVAASMPEDGRAGRVAIVLTLNRPPPPAWLSRIRMQLRFRQPALTEEHFVICDQAIQCPLVLPDGTVEPPRLLSAPESK